MPFYGYGYNCEDPVCPLDAESPHCHPGERPVSLPTTAQPPTSHLNKNSTPTTSCTSNTFPPSVHNLLNHESESDPAKARSVQPSLAAGGKVDLSRILGMELTNRATFSFGGTKIGAPTAREAEEAAAEARQVSESKSDVAMYAFPAPPEEIARASEAARRMQSGTTGRQDLTHSALRAHDAIVDQAARESETKPSDLLDRMNKIYEDHLRETARLALARLEEMEREREIDAAALRTMQTVGANDRDSNWDAIQARHDMRRNSRQRAAKKTRNQEPAVDATPETVPEPRRISLTTRISELPPIHEHTTFCIHQENGVGSRNTPIEIANSSSDVEEQTLPTQNLSNEADDEDFKKPARVYTGDSGFGGGEGDRSEFRRLSRVLTEDSAFASGDSSRSQSRERGKESAEEESD